MTEFKVQVDSPSHALDMVNVLEQCKGDRMVSVWVGVGEREIMDTYTV